MVVNGNNMHVTREKSGLVASRRGPDEMLYAQKRCAVFHSETTYDSPVSTSIFTRILSIVTSTINGAWEHLVPKENSL